jgi:CRISPR-associated protein Cas2
MRSFYLIVYDITDDRRRNKIAKLCESCAQRVQESVFEGYFNTSELSDFVTHAKKKMEKKEDSLRIYLLCADCRGKIKTWGAVPITPEPGVLVV